MHPFGFGIPPSDPRFHQVDTSTDHFKIKLAQSPNPDGSVEIRVDKDKVIKSMASVITNGLID